MPPKQTIPPQTLTDADMQRKFQECNMDERLRAPDCTTKRLDRDSYHDPIKNKREYMVVHLDGTGETLAITCHYNGPDGTPQMSVRLIVHEGTTYIQSGVL